MASGVITLTKTGNANLYGRILWESVSNGSQKNSSDVTVSIQLRRTSNEWTTTGTWKGQLTVGSKTESVSLFTSVSGSWVTIHTMTATVKHTKDGTGECYIYGKIDGPTQTTMEGTSVSGSDTVKLDKIARFATILSAENFTDEGNPTIKYSNPAGSAVSSLQACISLTGESADVPFRNIPLSGSSYTFNLTASERDTLRAAAANANELTVKFSVKSTIDGQSEYDAISATMTIVNANPTASISVSDTNDTTFALTGNRSRLVAGHSVASVTMSVTAKKSAKIPTGGVKVMHGTAELTGSGSFTGTFNPVTNNEITYSVIDSRGNAVNGKASNVIVPYINPKISINSAKPNAAGNMALVAIGKVFNGSFGSKANSITIKYRYKTGSGTYGNWQTISNVTLSGNDFVATAQVSGLDYQAKYTFQAAVYDSLHTNGVLSKAVGVTAFPMFDWGESDFQFHVPVYDETGAQIGNAGDIWQTPPFALGVQYATTERYLGKTVYAKLVNFGALPNAQSKNVTYYGTDPGTTAVVSMTAMMSNGNVLHAGLGKDRSVSTTGTITLDCTRFNIRIHTDADFSSLTAYVLVKYTLN